MKRVWAHRAICAAVLALEGHNQSGPCTKVHRHLPKTCACGLDGLFSVFFFSPFSFLFLPFIEDLFLLCSCFQAVCHFFSLLFVYWEERLRCDRRGEETAFYFQLCIELLFPQCVAWFCCGILSDVAQRLLLSAVDVSWQDLVFKGGKSWVCFSCIIYIVLVVG